MTFRRHPQHLLLMLFASFVMVQPIKAAETVLSPPRSEQTSPSERLEVIRSAAVLFLDSLDAAERSATQFDFSNMSRTDWHFVPKDRTGLSFKQMTLPQRRAARVLMRSTLSEKGYFKASSIMMLEQVLRTMEADRPGAIERRDPEKYWIAIYGDPTGDQPWAWRLEGHHLSLNFTLADKQFASVTPLFFGSNPAEIRTGPQRGLRVLGEEVDQAHTLLLSLTAEQQDKAIISPTAPADILSRPGVSIAEIPRQGIAAESMTAKQQSLLSSMIAILVHHLRPQLANQELRAIQTAGMERVHFAWAGSKSLAEKHYFRLHGPTFLLEYDNAQGNHAHMVWHSADDDFGAATLKRHYEEHSHE